MAPLHLLVKHFSDGTLASENRRVLATIEAEFERIDPEDIT